MWLSEMKLATIAGNFSKKKKKKIPLALLPGSFSVENATAPHQRVRSKCFLSQLCRGLREKPRSKLRALKSAGTANGECASVRVSERELRETPEQNPVLKRWPREV